jgi:hypothetical protein
MPADTDHRIELPLALQLRRRVSVRQAAELKGISEDTFRRHFGYLIEQLSPRRQGVELGKVLGPATESTD